MTQEFKPPLPVAYHEGHIVRGGIVQYDNIHACKLPSVYIEPSSRFRDKNLSNIKFAHGTIWQCACGTQWKFKIRSINDDYRRSVKWARMFRKVRSM